MARGNGLAQAAQSIIIGGAIAGSSNETINQRLHDAGYKSVTAQQIWYYRTLPEVQDALAKRDAEATLTGLALRSERVELAQRIIHDALDLIQKGETNQEGERKPLVVEQKVKLWEVVTRQSALIGKLVGDEYEPRMKVAIERAEQHSKEQDGNRFSGLTPMQARAFFNDMLRQFLRDEGIDPNGNAASVTAPVEAERAGVLALGGEVFDDD